MWRDGIGPPTLSALRHRQRPRVACQVCIKFPTLSLSFLLHHTTAMAPIDSTHRAAAHILARSAVAYLAQRDLTVKGAQGVTLGVIAAYVVGIAILWNIPYIKYVLWPFKVCVAYSCED